MKNIFQNRQLVLATKHKKEQVMIPLLEGQLGVACRVVENFDTDSLGTFTGEVERQHDALTTLRMKCLHAMEITSCDLGVASEGSFGPHPSIFLLPADDELVIFIDKKNNLEIIVRELSVECNFDGQEIKNEQQLADFAEKMKFPSHGIILRNAENGTKKIVKGIQDWDILRTTFHEVIEEFGAVFAETDMRAMNNPTRMKVIGIAMEKLVEKIQSLCPQCQTPGFGITKAKAGLPCQLCGSATQSALCHEYTCTQCHYETELKFPHHKETEDPMYCNFCNP